MKKLLINNTALRNNGDVALVLSLTSALSRRGHTVTVASSHPEFAQANHLSAAICPEFIGYKRPLFRKRIISDIASALLMISNKAYRKSDAIIGAPGGYINSFYGFSWKLNIYKWAHYLGKKSAIYSQSIGPLSHEDKDNLKNASTYLDSLVVRDELSYTTATKAGFSAQKITLTDDAIFLEPPKISSTSEHSRKVLISVREWKHEGRNIENYVLLIKNLAITVLSKGYEVEFASTCQGIPGYIDDSTLAKRIEIELKSENHQTTTCGNHLTLSQLKEKIDSAHFIIGTRLHMCLLAMTAGIPAFNISYEQKGIECYKSLQMEKHSIDYNTSPNEATSNFLAFLEDLPKTRKSLPDLVEYKHKIANTYLDNFLINLDKKNGH